MKICQCTRLLGFILAAVLVSLGLITHASAQVRSVLVDLNTCTVTPLGTFGGESSLAWGLNDLGQVAGWSDTAGNPHAFITGLHGSGMVDLNSLVDLPQRLVLTDAMAIKNNGHVVALASSPAVIPDPDTYALMLAGLGLMGLMERRRQKTRGE